MRVQGQSIPPEMQAAYDKLAVNQKVDGSGNGTVRSTKKATKGLFAKPTRKQLRDYENAVDFLIAYLKSRGQVLPWTTFRNEQIEALKNQDFDETYWQQCTIDSSVAILCNPASEPFSGPRNYAYPDPTNQPTRAIYSDGLESSGVPQYQGASSGGYFYDTALQWLRIVFSLKNSFLKGEVEPVFIKMSGNVSASADFRPSRAMISVIIKRWFVGATSEKLTTFEPPTTEPLNALWRYITPHGEAPYFNLTKDLNLMYYLRSSKYEEDAEELTKAVVLVAPMPMMGYRYNNNSFIETSLNLSFEMWQIRKAATIICGQSQTAVPEPHACYWLDGEIVDLGTLGGYSSTARLVSANREIIVGNADTVDGYNRACTWINGVIQELPTLGGYNSASRAMTDDASVIVGASGYFEYNYHAVRWVEGVALDMGTLGGTNSEAYFCSADGSVVVGVAQLSTGANKAFRWVAGVMTNLHDTSFRPSNAAACSADGLIVVGGVQLVSGNNVGFVWESGVMTTLPTLGGTNSTASLINKAGTIILGTSYLPVTGNHACRWDAGVITDLGTLGGNTSTPTALSEDGSVIIGTAVTAGGQTHACRWVDGVIEDLGTLGGTYSVAYAMNADGSIIVGSARDALNKQRPAIWVNGEIQELPTLGGDFGVCLALRG